MNIPIPIVRNWVVKIPKVYRYMDQKYIDEFFSTGRLRLSSFQLFAKHPDEQRADSQEGGNVIVGEGKDYTVMVSTQHGRNAFILCASMRGDEDLMKDFGTDGYFCISDTTNFGAAILQRIPGCIGGIEGFCTYADQRIIYQKLSEFNLDDLKAKPEDESLSLEKVISMAAQMGGSDVLFMKLGQYGHQNEYRFVWQTRYDVEEAIFVECPEAIQYCERVT